MSHFGDRPWDARHEHLRPSLLERYFTQNRVKTRGPWLVGAEIETSFQDGDGRPITLSTAQAIFRSLAESDWKVSEQKGSLITKLAHPAGGALLFELGRQNLEIATDPAAAADIVRHTRSMLDELYEVAALHGAFPRFEPLFPTGEDLLVVPDGRDQTWLDVDGRTALRPLAAISAVQYTVDVPPEKALLCINGLLGRISAFRADYPQEGTWREYIRSSKAGYRTDRYGGPDRFEDVRDYCRKLLRHDVVTPEGLKPHSAVRDLDIPLFIRSVWWYFRLRRYGDALAVEVRPLARRADEKLDAQLAFVLDAMNL